MTKKFISLIVAIITIQSLFILSNVNNKAVAAVYIKAAYKNLVNDLYDEEDLFCEYMIYDMDRDGTTELIYSKGTCEATHYMYYYTYKNGKAVFLGKTGGSWSGIYEIKNSVGVYWYYAIQGYECLYKVNKDGNSISINAIYEDRQSEKYTPPENELKQYQYNDYTGIDKYAISIKLNQSIKKLEYTASVDSVVLKWSKVSWATGYRVYKYDSTTKKYKSYKTLKDTKLKISGLKSGTIYKFKIKPYKKLDKDNVIWGEASDVLIACTKPKKTTITNISSKKAVATLTWNNVNGESGYQVWYSTKKSEGFKKYSNYKANTVKCSVKKLKSGKTYYFKVRAYKKVDGKVVYGSFSDVKNIRVK